uniref:Uncharacterized protein n=1 Tax=Rhizophora mucronata TaxID=61149 RepID=A0A2P2IM88_RHIMU
MSTELFFHLLICTREHRGNQNRNQAHQDQRTRPVMRARRRQCSENEKEETQGTRKPR